MHVPTHEEPEMPSSDLSDNTLSYYDSLLRRYLETLDSALLLFIEGEMQRMWAAWVWGPSEFVFFPYVLIETRQSRRIKWVTPYYGAWSSLCWARNQAVLWAQRVIHCAALCLMFPTACVKQEPNAVSFRTSAPVGCVPSPPGFFGSEDCSWRLCCGTSPHGSGYISVLAGIISWDSVLERIFRGSP